MKADASTEDAIKHALDQFAQSYARRDLNLLLSIFAPDPDMVLIGTGADERRIGLAELKRHAERDWAQSESATISYGWTSVSAAGPVAWVACDVMIRAKIGEQSMELPARLTAVFEHRGARWLGMQAHLSLPAAGEAPGESFPSA